MSGKMLVREFEQSQHALHRGDAVEIQLEFLGTQPAQRLFQGRYIQAFLVAEVMVDHPDIDARSGADGIDPPSRKSLGSEFIDRGAKDPLSCAGNRFRHLGFHCTLEHQSVVSGK